MEAIWLTRTYTAPTASLAPEWQPLLTLFNDGHHYTAAIVLSSALLLALSSRLGDIRSALMHQSRYAWWPWAVLHLLALLAFVHMTARGFGSTTGAPNLSAIWFGGWAIAGTATLVFWLFVLAPAAAWVQVLRQQRLALLLGLAAGAAVWGGGILVQSLWEPLAGGTVRLSALVLSAVYPEIVYDPVRGAVGTRDFLIDIQPVCSGYEGIALVTVFVSVYLWLFREHLSFPRAFLLFPLGIAAIWLTNVLRIAALVVVGTSVSPEVAASGFHSQAGWIAFTLVTLGAIAISHRWLSVPREGQAAAGSAPAGRPELALLLPLLVLMAASMAAAAMSDGLHAFYPLGVAATAAVLWHYRSQYRALFGSWSWEPFAIGVLVFVMWALLVPGSPGDTHPMADRASQWSTWFFVAWIQFRVIGSVVTVPIAEELAFRGYLIRKLVSSDFENVRPGHFTWLSFVLSSLLFGLLHQNILAGALAGAAFAFALYRRGLVGDAIVAHMTANGLIAVAVLGAGRWAWWG